MYVQKIQKMRAHQQGDLSADHQKFYLLVFHAQTFFDMAKINGSNYKGFRSNSYSKSQTELNWTATIMKKQGGAWVSYKDITVKAKSLPYAQSKAKAGAIPARYFNKQLYRIQWMRYPE